MNHFPSLPKYEEFIYNLSDFYPSVLASTLVVVRRSAKQALIAGEIRFANGYRLTVSEIVDFADNQFVITRYGYEGWQGNQKLYWYDSQPHPGNPDLALNHPHHKHVPPDIKHNRVPAPALRFEQPNLPFLIQEMEQILRS